MKPKDDPTIARIRATRRRISKQFDHDPQRLVAHYMTLQEEYRRLLRVPNPSQRHRSRKTRGLWAAMQRRPAGYAAKEANLLTLLQGDS